MESFFRRLFEASPHPYMVLRPDKAFTIEAVNDRYVAATGTKREEIVGRGLFEVFPDDPGDPGATSVNDLRLSLQRVLADGVQDVMGVQKYDIPRLDGSGFEVRYWSPVNIPVTDAAGHIGYILHYAEDVTEFILSKSRASAENTQTIERVQAHADRMQADVLRRASEVKEANRELMATRNELARLNDQLTALDHAKTAFFSNISHEFRTPLTLMLGPLGDLLDDAAGGLTGPQREQLETAHRNALRLLKLVNSLLGFARAEAGRAHLSFEPLDLALTTRELAGHFQSACDKAGLTLVVDCPPLPEAVFADRNAWETIVLNLLSNAFKFTHGGAIAVRLRAGDGVVTLTVSDTGSGIPESEMPHLFERFHRVEGAPGRSFEGSGIGLALVQELARMHGGSVRADSTPGVGSHFHVTLPLGHAHLPAARLRPAASAAPAFSQAGAFAAEAERWLADLPEPVEAEGPPAGLHGPEQPLVLLADDNADMRGYVQRILAAAGCRVTVTGNGAEALDTARSNPPDLVLSDVMMPTLDGFGLLQALRADPQTSDIPVILLSARAGEDARVEGLSAGADDYLVKPFGARELVARVRGTLRLARMRQETAAAERRVVEKALGLSEDRLHLALDSAGMGMWDWDIAADCLTWSATCKAIFGKPADVAMSYPVFLDSLHPDDRAAVDDLCRRCLDPAIRAPYDAQYRVVWPDGSQHWVLARGKAWFDGARPVRFTGTALDVTAQKEAERHLRILVDELSHRVKNTLAVIQSLTEQTFRTGDGVDGIRQALTGRLQTLADAHTLLTLSKWESVDLGTLAERVAGHLAVPGDGRFHVAGPPARLTAKASLAFALVLHELCTNAAKHGAWAAAGGTVAVEWRITADDVVLEWTETAATAVSPPTRFGFGTRLIAQAVDYDLDGTVTREFPPAGLRCTVTVPAYRALAAPGRSNN
ncbi:ATP-binding protein [Azospirillum fermentarium]|uniref:ATP-binding protein n=1 Tax=Azospirillum fermentarium TaxID=1233114 RepID=UPI00222686C0|nr:ATP-binding protein [Azospirillum fermentarium]